MSSALKPVLTSAGAQNPSVPSQLNKPMHPQGAPATYGQPVSHIPQNLVNIPHNPPSSASVHNPAHSNTHSVPHHINTNTHSTSHSANHYSLNVPNASQHYPVSGNTPVSSHSTSLSNHPVSNANQSHTQPTATFSSPPKPLSYNPNFQANLGHSYKPMNVTSTQNVPTTQAVTAASEESSTEKPQSNGTPEVKVTTKAEPPQNHISSPGIKDKPPPVQTSPLPLPEKAKVSPEKPGASNVAAVTAEPKQNADVNKVSESNSTSVDTVEKSSAQTEPASTTVPSNSANTVSNAEVSSSVALPSSTAEVSTQPQHPQTTTTTTTTNTSTVTPVSQLPLQTTNAGSEEVQEPQEPITITTAAGQIQNKPKEQNNQKSTLKLATTPRTPVRKAKTPKLEVTDTSKTLNKNETKSPTQKSPSSGGKSKRTRTKTQPYQSPLPEVEMISKITATTPRNRNSEDKLIIFYKNEFLAVRNSEGGFYVCQAMQNIYKSSPRIRIRWLSQDKNDKEIYTPDFYDYTDFDCILTNLNLGRVDKGKYKLPSNERIRTDSILKRALAVEKGDATPPSLTEEHPDGLDLSLYKEESQLKKRKAAKRKAATPLKTSVKANNTKKSPDQAKVRKVVSKPKTQAVKKSTVLKRALAAKVKKPDVGRAERAAKRRIQEQPKNPVIKTSPVIDQKKAKVLAKVARKPPTIAPPTKIQPPTKQNVKSAKPAASTSKKPVVMAKKEKIVVTRKSKRGKK
ncbi:hypothetical protein ILUMI_02854 [Ignelater luminosus]|uniref:Muscle M-line assembly protein unc-89 n=1 Tax=Ignelater luminosus TaxID=2038154 RepID=A0A8K0GMS9_IGNLU|nr:hypothetical protein ILUMI_02854 [Ignelater luminosus]